MLAISSGNSSILTNSLNDRLHRCHLPDEYATIRKKMLFWNGFSSDLSPIFQNNQVINLPKQSSHYPNRYKGGNTDLKGGEHRSQ